MVSVNYRVRVLPSLPWTCGYRRYRYGPQETMDAQSSSRLTKSRHHRLHRTLPLESLLVHRNLGREHSKNQITKIEVSMV